MVTRTRLNITFIRTLLIWVYSVQINGVDCGSEGLIVYSRKNGSLISKGSKFVGTGGKGGGERL